MDLTDLKKLNPDFFNFFSEQYGQNWSSIEEQLIRDPKQVQRKNEFFQFDPTLESEYTMDWGSVLSARQLPIKPGDLVLDMCAAPGGKSLILAEKLFATGDSSGELICNEMSSKRRDRLKWVLQHYIPRSHREQVFIQGKDANVFGQRQIGYFDAVLLDAPCSGERHLLENKKEFKDWSVSRTKSMAQRQFSLISSAWLTVKSGGHVLYSTCSLSPFENDGVIAKLKSRRAIEVLACPLVETDASVVKTEFGYLVRPDLGENDQEKGAGPIFFSLFRKLD